MEGVALEHLHLIGTQKHTGHGFHLSTVGSKEQQSYW